jgi:hypothetical protein
VLIPPIGDAAACPALVAGIEGAPVRLTAPGPFAPNVGTVLEGNPAVSGFVLVGAEDEVPLDGSKGFAPELDGEEPGTAMEVPVALVGGSPPG